MIFDLTASDLAVESQPPDRVRLKTFRLIFREKEQAKLRPKTSLVELAPPPLPPFTPVLLSNPLSLSPSFLRNPRWLPSLQPRDGLPVSSHPSRLPPSSPDPLLFLVDSLSILHATSLRTLHSSILRSSFLPKNSRSLPSAVWEHTSSCWERHWRRVEICCFPN